jgi:hypothetical protein
VKLTTTKTTSLVFAVGNDYDRAVARTLPAGWVIPHQWVNAGAGDTYWSECPTSQRVSREAWSL